ncbi:BnaA09g53970D [Brassica napus]|uniref:(rape) hypothetical protein n=1 Tax=Brassica napus TaxID=3708 RepID=A0A078IX39_BRANA|nr:unnamed protein product [Brassica napus]CDY53568.1 BnaA09g53970D [Brassica napus]
MFAPSPSKSGMENMSLSKLFIIIRMISSFVYLLA